VGKAPLIGSLGSLQTANQVKFAVSAVFKFAVKEEVVASNPTKNIEDNPVKSRERILSATELRQFWAACDQIHPVKAAALRTVLLTGARPGEVCRMRWEHVRDHSWEQPGDPVPALGWLGTKNSAAHRLWLPARVREIIGYDDAGRPGSGFVFTNERGNAYGGLHDAMRELSRMCGFNPPVTPHDLRRTHGSTITGRGHGRPSMDRLLNHKAKSISDVYDRYDYSGQDQAIWEDVVAAILATAEGRQADSVVVSFHR
jgi:integrase